MCLKCFWKVSGRYQDGLRKVFGRYPECVLKVSGICLECVWKVFVRCLDGVRLVIGWCLVGVKTGQVGTDQFGAYYISAGQKRKFARHTKKLRTWPIFFFI